MRCVRKPVLSLLLAAAGLWAASSLANSADPRAAIIGRASLLEAGTPAYQEHYFFDASVPWPSRVEYRQPNGDLLSIKQLDHSVDPLRPSFRQRNLHTGRLIEVDFTAGRVNLLYREGAGKRTIRSEIPLPANGVVDAGFDAYVRQNFGRLQAGERLVFDFLLPTRQRFVSLAIQKKTCADIQNASLACFVIRPDNRLLSWFATPIELQYDVRERRLQRFSGLSNLLDARGEGMTVKIQYWYDERLYPDGASG